MQKKLAISYQVEKTVSVTEFLTVLEKSTLAERRPVEDFERLQAMLDNANLIVTARYEGNLIGIARSITDFVYATYLSDLAVDTFFQKQGIGTELIRQTKLKAPKSKVILISAPKAVEYYPKIGMELIDFAYKLDDIEKLK